MAHSPDTLAFITEITHRDGKSAHSAIHQLHALLDRLGADALRATLSRAVETILHGKPGRGKTHLAIASLTAHCRTASKPCSQRRPS